MTSTFLMVLLFVVWGFISLAMLACLVAMVVAPPRIWVPALMIVVLCIFAVIQSSEASFSVVFNQEVQPCVSGKKLCSLQTMTRTETGGAKSGIATRQSATA